MTRKSRTTPTSVQAGAPTTNPSRIVRFFYDNPDASRAQCARALDLTPAAVTIITSRLIDAGILVASTQASASRNGRAVGLRVNATQYKVIGVKFARTVIELGVFDISGALISHHTFPPATDASAHESIKEVRQTIAGLVSKDPSIRSVGIAVPGPYFPDTGHVGVITSLPTWGSLNFREEFENSFGLPCFIEQDARAGVLAQSLFDTSTDSSSLAYYLLGEGVGLGVIENGKLVSGFRGAACEIGHVSIDVNGLACECGNRGCLERYCSATAIRDHLLQHRLIEDVEHTTAKEAVRKLFAAADAGDTAAVSYVCDIGKTVGYGCVTIINSFNPHHIVLGDILSAGGPILLNAALEVVRERVLPQMRETTVIDYTRLPHDPILLGAAATATEHLLSNPSDFLNPTSNHSNNDK